MPSYSNYRCLKSVSRVFQGSFKGVSRKFQWCFKEVSKVFQESFRGVSRKFQGCFDGVSGKFTSFKEVSCCMTLIAVTHTFKLFPKKHTLALNLMLKII